ncbi:MAG: hypothetical protein SCARUB_03589 [Candidatus Scalindua rubra]|uniref:Uncharacterized protein n=1 Tax=Candidatus Scalindua rubra TaxID=1872076 RepID=A0A1E3X6L5_9BACT|nr:MAG: hypothetical protein SCARUB_03589 [Candidatus Scalindua rubra]
MPDEYDSKKIVEWKPEKMLKLHVNWWLASTTEFTCPKQKAGKTFDKVKNYDSRCLPKNARNFWSGEMNCYNFYFVSIPTAFLEAC